MLDSKIIGFIAIAIAIMGLVLPIQKPIPMNFTVWKTGAFSVVSLPQTFGMINCTGITTGSLTTGGPGNILITGQYTIKEDVSGQDFQLVVGIGTAQPATTFSNGDCAATNTNEWFLAMHFTTTTRPMTTTFSVTLVPATGGNTATTYFGWLALQNICSACVGNVNVQSSGQRAGSFITMLELK